MKKGFSIIEFLIAVAMSIVVVFGISIVAKDIISLNSSGQANLTAQIEGKKVVKVMVSELRRTSPSAQGGYPIETAATNTLTFFADINDDENADRIRYFIDIPTRTIKRGVVLAAGLPPSYNLGNESITTLISSISNGTSTALFSYYNGNYAGTSSPLSVPVDIPSVRLIKITAKIEQDPNRSPAMMTVTSQASLRNLKDNL
ncbi:MAG: Type IV pilus pilin [Parcubacteria bacterium C7867-005]|nr:MAG: Type IV pilus pilin [Parcubacteria bacterium C7867-005]